MILKSSYQINYTVLPAGTELEIIKQEPGWMHQGTVSFLWEVKNGENKGFKFWSCIGNLKHSLNWYKPAPAHIRLHIINDYLDHGWTPERLQFAGLVPKNYLHLLPQYCKYYHKLKTAENF